MKFYLGTHMANWLWGGQAPVPLFVSHRRLMRRKSGFPRAVVPWALDSGGFTELKMYGEWRTSPQQYVEDVRRFVDEIGSLEWASPQDWMCEPDMLAKTGLTVKEHQARTIENYWVLRDLAPELPFIPVLQGWTMDDYHAHVDAYTESGLDLACQSVVGVGSVCRRQATDEIGQIFGSLRSRGLRMHGYGVKSDGLRAYSQHLVSADSLAWAYGGWKDGRKKRLAGRPTACGRRTCNNCAHYALAWRDRLLRRAGEPALD